MTALRPDVPADLSQENTRLQAELRAAEERQIATAEILRTIASTPGDAGRSLQQIAETSARLFGAPSVSLQLAENGEWGQAFRIGSSANQVRSAVPLATIRIGGSIAVGVRFHRGSLTIPVGIDKACPPLDVLVHRVWSVKQSRRELK
jgi:two-component system, NtrC family, sensor kinase